MQAHQERVVAEKEELDGKIDRLDNFRASPTFGTLAEEDQNLLFKQLGIMRSYSEVLASRIDRF